MSPEPDSVEMASRRQGRGADALLAFPRGTIRSDYHQALSRELPVIAFYLYQAAGGVAYDDDTLHAIFDLPEVIGIKVATLDSVMTFQRIAAVAAPPRQTAHYRRGPVLGYSLMLGARAALVGMGAALPDLQAGLLRASDDGGLARPSLRPSCCDRFRPQATFIEPMEGYVRRMLWARGRGRRPARRCLRRSLGAATSGRARPRARQSSARSGAMRARLARDFERFKRELPSDLARFICASAYRIDLTARYLGHSLPHPIGKGSGQLSLNPGQLETDRAAGLAFVVLKTVIARGRSRRAVHGRLGDA